MERDPGRDESTGDGARPEEPPLDGVRVVEIAGGIPAAFAGRELGGFGAEVVRVEGHAAGLPLTEAEEVYLVVGKRRVEASGEELRRLVLAADILIEDGAPGHLRALGLDPIALRAENPALVIVSISPFGQTGPYRNYKATNIVSFAMGGIMALTGDFDNEPLVSGGSQAQYLAGLHGFSSAVTAYLGAILQGEGDWIDLSAQECAAGMLELYGPSTAYGDEVRPRMGNHTRAEWGIYPCIDGYVGMFALQRQVPSLFEAVGDPELIDGPFLDSQYRLDHVDELAAQLYVWTLSHTKEEMLALGRKHRVPIGLVLTPAELLEAPSLDERGYWDEPQTASGPVRMPGRPFAGVAWRPPGRLHEPGEDTGAVMRDWLGDTVPSSRREAGR